jgi:hypothetical protein
MSDALARRARQMARELLNQVWKQVGCEGVDAMLSSIGMLCPVCGARGLGDDVAIKMEMTYGPDGCVSHSTCRLCSHEWETGE